MERLKCSQPGEANFYTHANSTVMDSAENLFLPFLSISNILAQNVQIVAPFWPSFGNFITIFLGEDFSLLSST